MRIPSAALVPDAARFVPIRQRVERAMLLSASVVALLVTSPLAQARCIGSCGLGGASAVTTAATSAIANAQQASQVAQAAQNSLTRATLAVQAMQAAQSTARNLALSASSSVPNGLAPGGLVPDSGLAQAGAANPVTTWQGATTPTQSANGNQTIVNIQQTAPQAILNWQTFNVGTNTTVDFNQQGNTSWVALNRIAASGVPSQILGSIKADGQVYLINPNGIIFGGASQINVSALIASSANLDPTQFLTTGIYSTESGGGYSPSFTNAGGAIVVEPGALIATHTPSSVTSGGGFVLLMGTQVDNAGSIVTPGGQTELAAGDNFLLRPGYSTNANSWSTTHGNEIAVELNSPGSSTSGGSGLVSNDGYIEADTGDITLAGETVVQNGVLISTTSVNVRGTIHLLSSASDPSSSVTLTGNSFIGIFPDSSGATALNSQRAALIADSATQDSNRGIDNSIKPGAQFDDLSPLSDLEDESRVEIVTGGTVHFENGSLTLANGGQVAVSATQRVQVDSAAAIDVSGLVNVVLPMSANEIAVNIQGNELRDDPNNRDTGTLFNSTFYVDVRDLTLVPAGTGGYSTDRYYTSGGLLEVSGWLNTTPHTIGEWMAIGGSITLATGSGGAVVAQPGSVFNISGGSIQYQGGYLRQTYLIGSDGRIYNVNNAPANLTYSLFNGFVVNHAHWGVTDTYWSPLRPLQVYEQSFTVGRDAGSLILSTPTSIFEGTVEAGVIDGALQTTARPASVTDPYLLTQTTVPLAGQIELGSVTAGTPYDTAVVIGQGTPLAASLSANDAIPADRIGTAYFDANQLSADGLGGLTIGTSNAPVNSVAVDAPLTMASGGQVSFTAYTTIDVSSIITARGGSVSLLTAPSSSNGSGNITLHSGATIDTRGLFTNGLLNPNDLAGVAFANGGSVTLTAGGDLTLEQGSAINASSGAAILPSGKTQGGAGGNITLTADYLGQNGELTLAGTLQSYGVTHGGTLTINAGNAAIAITDLNQPLVPGNVLHAGEAAPVELVLAQALTVPAGATLPFSFHTDETTAFPGQALPATAYPQFGYTSGGVPIVLAAAWTVPQGAGTVGDYSGKIYKPGNTLPAGTLLWLLQSLPAGYVVPADAFPNGIPIAPLPVYYAAGTSAPQAVTFPVGSVIPAGTVVPVALPVNPVVNLRPSLFSAGFSQYNITSYVGVDITAGTAINVVEPVYQITGATYGALTGSDPATALSLWTPPLYSFNPASGMLSQRAGASLTITAGLGDVIGGYKNGGIVMNAGSSITVDSGQSVTMIGGDQITIDGAITAPGGEIKIVNDRPLGGYVGPTYAVGGLSVWIGDDAVLNAAGETYTVDYEGRSYGTVTNGGTIVLGHDPSDPFNPLANLLTYSTDAFLIIRPGAVIDASGASAVTDVGFNPVTVASSGGTISLASTSGIYWDGTLEAQAGGPNAAGGTLLIWFVNPDYVPNNSNFQDQSLNNGTGNGGNNGIVPVNELFSRMITIGQVGRPNGLPADLQPGQSDPALTIGQAYLSANTIAAGGFGNLIFAGGVAYDGNVTLTASQSITMPSMATAGATNAFDTVAGATVILKAPYVSLGGATSVPQLTNPGSIPVFSLSGYSVGYQDIQTFNAEASLIDIGQLSFGGALPAGATNSSGPDNDTIQSNFLSQGDIRFTGGAILTPGSLTFTAAQIYPTTGAQENITAGADYYNPNAPGTGITFNRVGSTDPAPPDSVFGSLTLSALTINQNGVVRAPLGTLIFQGTTVNLGAGSITSVSANGITSPYGGTTDGVTYDYNGSSVVFYDPVTGKPQNNEQSLYPMGISLSGTVTMALGAVLDLSGGGTLTGAGFISGRGGSVNVLTTPLINANPANSYSAASDQVYAILPGYQSGYAPIDPAGTTTPGIGQQITIGAGVPGLPAGTYTLLPANYALLPGAYRVETTSKMNAQLTGASALGNGSYLVNGYQGVANTGIVRSLPTEIIISPGSAVRTYSQYDEESYSQFVVSQAATFGTPRATLPADAKFLEFNLGAQTGSFLNLDGTVLFAPAAGGYGGSLVLTADNLEITAPGAASTSGWTTIAADQIDELGAANVYIGGNPVLALENAGSSGSVVASNIIGFSAQSNAVAIRSGATLTGAQVFLLANAGGITVEQGATVSTIGQGNASFDASSGYVYMSSYPSGGQISSGQSAISSPAMLALSNGQLDVIPGAPSNNPPGQSGPITIADGASLYSDGTINFSTFGTLSLGTNANYGAKYLSFSSAEVNIGTTDALASAAASGVLPQGIVLNQDVLDRLIAGNAAAGVPALQALQISASQSVNIFGSVNLNTASGTSAVGEIDLSTPAVYGMGGSGDVATITTGTLVWNGLAVPVPPFNASSNPTTYNDTPPGPVIANGPGTGAGTLDINANTVIFGYASGTQPQNQTALGRLVLGFSTVNITASQKVTANNKGTLAVYESGTSAAIYTGGTLNITTPLFTGEAGSVMGYTAGGALNVGAPATGVASTASAALGAEIDLTGNTITLNTAVGLPSGKLDVNATSDIVLGGTSNIDLSGRATPMFDQIEYSWGGNLVMESAHGNIIQAGGSLINISALNNAAGSVTATATDANAGQVIFGGTILGNTSGQYDAGGSVLPFAAGTFDVRAQSVGDFVALNQMLNAGGVFGTRSFDIKQGSLTVGNDPATGQPLVNANLVSISIDNGSLTVDGTINASGVSPGSITLAASGDLTLNGMLDAHGTQLRVDSYGNPINANNGGTISLTSTGGTLTLGAGSVLDVSVTSPQGVPLAAQGDIELNAPRLGSGAASATGAGAPANATGNDIAISASGPLTIIGAASIAVNAFAIYTDAPADPNDPNGQIVAQSYLAQIDQDSQAFIAGIYNNNVTAGILTANLQGKLAGLLAYGSAFHLRPGVEIDSATPNGNITVQGDLDFSGSRYGPPVNPTVYGSGEPGYFVLRAGGNLNINGSINDGFAPPPATPDDNSWLTTVTVPAGTVEASTTTLNYNITLTTAWTIPSDYYYTNTITQIVTTGGNYIAGQTIPAGATINVTGGCCAGPFAFEAGITLPGYEYWTPSSKTGQMWAVSPMLPAGDLSWSMRLVSGADLTAAGSRVLQAANALNGAGNMTLNDPHLAGTDQVLAISVVRTGTGSLELLAGGNFSEESPFGVYTAGTQSPDVTSAYNLPRPLGSDGTVLGAANAGYEAAIQDYQAYYPENGGNVLVSAQGNITGYVATSQNLTALQTNFNNSNAIETDNVDNWLWRQGGGEIGEYGAWWINFGTYVPATDQNTGNTDAVLVGFSGIGALGGGNVTVLAGGSAGVMAAGNGVSSQALVVAIGSTGRVTSINQPGGVVIGGALEETGGGDVTLKIGGALNPVLSAPPNQQGDPFDGGTVTDLRGHIDVAAGSIGQIDLTYGQPNPSDPRAFDALSANSAFAYSGLVLVPGDATVNIDTRGDLVLAGVGDPGRLYTYSADFNTTSAVLSSDPSISGYASSWFSLWRPDSAISLFSAGGNLVPETGGTSGNDAVSYGSTNALYPGIFNAVAASGSIYFNNGAVPLELAPSPIGQLTLVAEDSIYGLQQPVEVSGAQADTNSLPNPFRPAFMLLDGSGNEITYTNGNPVTNTNPVADPIYGPFGPLDPLFAFEIDSVTGTLHAANPDPALIYAVTGDIVNLQFGQIVPPSAESYETSTWYIAGTPVDVQVGRDIVNFGLPSSPSLILNTSPTDISTVVAGRDIFYANIDIAGPGLLLVQAGRNLYQAGQGALTSIGPIGASAASVPTGGAGITVLAGVGQNGPDYADFANTYVDPASKLALRDASTIIAGYDEELYAWLQQRFGYSGPGGGAYAYFKTLPAQQQDVFLRQVYFEELNASGLEYNDTTSIRFNSYLRGKDAIAALFPTTGRNGQPITYNGSVTMSDTYSGGIVTGASNITTQFGGDIQLLTPGGETIVGVEGANPPGTAGILTQGTGNIDIYSLGSVLLGQSRIMTTFGGNILIWSATGDINAGRGTKTTVVYTPPRVVYDNYGNVALSPQVPSTGAGIATLNPIPQVPRGNINLVAPEGVIDAGEAGIRVSGNINLAALQIINAANIQVQGTATGLPTVTGPNIGALTTANNTAGAAQTAVPAPTAGNNDRSSIIIVEFVGFGGSGSSAPADGQDELEKKGRQSQNEPRYNPDSRLQIIGLGELTEEQKQQLSESERRNLFGN